MRLTMLSLMGAGGRFGTAVDRKTQFLNTDHRLVVAAQKLQLKSGEMVPYQLRLDVGKLMDERVAEESANRLNRDLGWGGGGGGLGVLRNPKRVVRCLQDHHHRCCCQWMS